MIDQRAERIASIPPLDVENSEKELEVAETEDIKLPPLDIREVPETET